MSGTTIFAHFVETLQLEGKYSRFVSTPDGAWKVTDIGLSWEQLPHRLLTHSSRPGVALRLSAETFLREGARMWILSRDRKTGAIRSCVATGRFGGKEMAGTVRLLVRL